jgi:uncharacterized protein (UPF0261 family)
VGVAQNNSKELLYYHDLLNDVGKEVVMSDINAWLTDRLPA